jgi:dTDP-4-amino-4,6-dideoxygalactose transaminase
MSEAAPMIPVAKPLMDEREADAARRPILSGWVTQGPEVAAFEQEFAEYTGASHACAVANCTVALHLGLLAVGVRAGDEVITVSHSYIATANSVRYCGAVPVFVDIAQGTSYNIDPAKIEAAITPKTRAILCVHQMGMPCDMAAIMEIARRHNLPVVEDAACAIGSEIVWEGEWQKIGRPIGDVVCFSFHPRKLVTTGDGGMLTTNNPDYDRQFRLWRQHGMSVPDTVRHGAREVIFESYPMLGYNYRMTDIQAAVGREQLKRLTEIIERRRRLADLYFQKIADAIPGIQLPEEPEWVRSNWQSLCVMLPEELDQRQVMQRMLDANIATRRGIMCAHREEAYEEEPWSAGGIDGHHDPQSAADSLPNSEYAQDHSIVLPLFHQLTEEDLDRVVASLREACIDAVATVVDEAIG